MLKKIVNRTSELPKGKGAYRRRVESVIDMVVVHCSGAPSVPDNAMSIASYHADTLDWPGIGYHYIVNPGGKVEKVNDISTISYHASGYNSRSIGICMPGVFDATPPSRAQLEACINLCRELLEKIPSIKRIVGHRELPKVHKTCPGVAINMDTFRLMAGVR